MPQLSVQSVISCQRLESIEGASLALPSPEHAFTHLQFRRFAGCPICHLHLQQFAARAHEISNQGIQEIVFFHSTPTALRKYSKALPFPLVADWRKRYYRSFGVEASLMSLLHPRAVLSAARGVLRKGLGLSLKGGPLGLPADILLDASGTVRAVKYGRHADDQWSVDTLLEIAKNAVTPQTD
ncbi:redoxin domain-containing protein [Pelagicoccus sp. SDUM812003]|uniref:redoxin domain-containing protein n=1 Tax=Pelagicoccus sp. SDUM812003 TaxID=3041267 RepID=UPI0028104DB2|nr:redoxin domain-containing protein [Pelagicoccus sp. SDUM812003]MDQ8202051.1 redoxin domain-containing protein [Pelagicoccus sp. SDUM812003]